jgi:hypothetical protein
MGDQLHVFHNGYDWVAAGSLDEAVAILVKLFGSDPAGVEGDGWEQLDDTATHTFTAHVDDLDLASDSGWVPPGTTVEVDTNRVEMRRVTATAAAWAANNGRGLIASTEV